MNFHHTNQQKPVLQLDMLERKSVLQQNSVLGINISSSGVFVWLSFLCIMWMKAWWNYAVVLLWLKLFNNYCSFVSVGFIYIMHSDQVQTDQRRCASTMNLYKIPIIGNMLSCPCFWLLTISKYSSTNSLYLLQCYVPSLQRGLQIHSF